MIPSDVNIAFFVNNCVFLSIKRNFMIYEFSCLFKVDSVSSEYTDKLIRPSYNSMTVVFMINSVMYFESQLF